MALPPPATQRATPKVIEDIKACVRNPNIGGRIKRDQLAAIALNLGVEGSNKPWVGHVLALLCESLEASVINEIMAHGHGRYKKEWDKWELGTGPRPPWQNRRGEDAIRNLVYDLLMNDLIVLYSGYEVDGGVKIKPLSVKGVCKKVKDEIGIVVIKDSYLREKLEYHRVTRNQKGQTVVRSGRNPQSSGSPSTLGGPSPPSLDIPPSSPRQNPTSRQLPANLNISSRRLIPTHHAYGSSGISSQSGAAAVAQRADQPQPLKDPSYYLQNRTHNPSSMQAVPRKPLHNSRDTNLPLRILEGLAPNPIPGDGMFIGTDNSSHNSQFMSGSLGMMSSSKEKIGSTEEKRLLLNPTSSVECIVSYADNPYNNYNISSPLPLVLTAEACTPESQFNQGLHQLSEQMKILTNRLDTELRARDARADEVVKWQNQYKSLGESYQELSSGYDHLTQKSQYLEGLCKSLEESKVSEQSKREQLSIEMENLLQKYQNLDMTVQRLNNANEALQSTVQNLQSNNRMQAEHIDNLQSSLTKSNNENNELKTDLSRFKQYNSELRTHNDSLSTEVTHLIGMFGKIKDEKLKFEKNAEDLQEQKDSLQHEADRLRAENERLYVQVAQLQEAKHSLSEQVGVLERECASFHEAGKTADTDATQTSQSHLSYCTIDSAMGESIRASTLSRKRQISITDEQEEKRHKSLHLAGEVDGTFLADADPESESEGLLIMPTSGTSYRSRLEAPAHNAGEKFQDVSEGGSYFDYDDDD